MTNDDLSIYDGIASDVEFITHEIKRNKPLETMAKGMFKTLLNVSTLSITDQI